jgi:hypothetical protein
MNYILLLFIIIYILFSLICLHLYYYKSKIINNELTTDNTKYIKICNNDNINLINNDNHNVHNIHIQKTLFYSLSVIDKYSRKIRKSNGTNKDKLDKLVMLYINKLSRNGNANKVLTKFFYFIRNNKIKYRYKLNNEDKHIYEFDLLKNILYIILSEKDRKYKYELLDILKYNIYDIVDDNNDNNDIKCTEGRISRYIQTVQHYLPDIHLVPLWYYKDKMGELCLLYKARFYSKIKSSPLLYRRHIAVYDIMENLPVDEYSFSGIYSEIYNEILNCISVNIKKKIKSVYIDTGILSQTECDLILVDYIENLF